VGAISRRRRRPPTAITVLLGLVSALMALAVAGPAMAGPPTLGAPMYVKYYVVAAAYQGAPENLSEIADRFLNSTSRSSEIFQLNAGVAQVDGGKLTDPATLHAGWVLTLPWDAVGQGVQYGLLPTATATAPPVQQPQTPPVPAVPATGATVMPVRIVQTSPTVVEADQASAIEVAVSAGARVVALGDYLDLAKPAVINAIELAVAHDVLVVAGASASPTTASDASSAKALGGLLRVGAISIDGTPVKTYQPGAVDVVAPGVDVASVGISGTVAVGGWSEDGCHGTFVAIPMSGDKAKDDPDQFAVWWFTPTAGLTQCDVQVFHPNSGRPQDSSATAAQFYVLAGRSGSRLAGFVVDQSAMRGSWVDVGEFPVGASGIAVQMVNRGVPANPDARLGAAQVRVRCTP
jgi:hypothetical protein